MPKQKYYYNEGNSYKKNLDSKIEFFRWKKNKNQIQLRNNKKNYFEKPKKLYLINYKEI